MAQITFRSKSGRSGRDPLIAEDGEVERTIAPADDQFGERAADARRLLQAVAGEAVGVEEIRQLRIGADHGVLVERVVVVVAGPGAGHLEPLEGGHARGEKRPEHLLEDRVVGREIGRVGGASSASGGE